MVRILNHFLMVMNLAFTSRLSFRRLNVRAIMVRLLDRFKIWRFVDVTLILLCKRCFTSPTNQIYTLLALLNKLNWLQWVLNCWLFRLTLIHNKTFNHWCCGVVMRLLCVAKRPFIEGTSNCFSWLSTHCVARVFVVRLFPCFFCNL